MEMQHLGEATCRDPGELTNDADDQPLRARDAEPLPHPLRDSLQTVIHGPEQTHELQDVGKVLWMDTEPGGAHSARL